MEDLYEASLLDSLFSFDSPQTPTAHHATLVQRAMNLDMQSSKEWVQSLKESTTILAFAARKDNNFQKFFNLQVWFQVKKAIMR